jgi:hypothetical protein
MDGLSRVSVCILHIQPIAVDAAVECGDAGFVAFGAEKPVIVHDIVPAQSAFAAGLLRRRVFFRSGVFGWSLVSQIKLPFPTVLAVGGVAHGPSVLSAGNVGAAIFAGSFR